MGKIRQLCPGDTTYLHTFIDRVSQPSPHCLPQFPCCFKSFVHSLCAVVFSALRIMVQKIKRNKLRNNSGASCARACGTRTRQKTAQQVVETLESLQTHVTLQRSTRGFPVSGRALNKQLSPFSATKQGSES